MPMRTHHAIVIGAGFSGASLTIELARRMPAGARVALIGRPQETGRGIAYRDDGRDLLLNVPANRLSLDATDDAGFVRWLGRGDHDDAAFASRAEYGAYVRDTLFAAVKTAQAAIDVIEGTVVAITPEGDDFAIRLANGERLIAGQVALCLGNAPPRFRIPEEAVAAGAQARMIADPWNDPRMGTIAGRERVLLVGAGLTMIDQILTLRHSGHTGPITAISRHGRLPAVHAATLSPPAAIDLDGCKGRLLPLFRAIVAAARAADARGQDWRPIIDGLRSTTQDIWQRFTLTEQHRFLRHVESYWAVVRHRMAPVVAARIESVLAAGDLDVIAGRVVAVRTTRGALTAAVRMRGARVVRLLPFDWIVNCTGPGRFASLAANPVVASLVDAGLARADRASVGLDVDADCRVVSADDCASPRLFAIGPLTAGRFWESTAVPEIRHQTVALATHLAAIGVAQTAAADIVPRRVDMPLGGAKPRSRR